MITCTHVEQPGDIFWWIIYGHGIHVKWTNDTGVSHTVWPPRCEDRGMFWNEDNLLGFPLLKWLKCSLGDWSFLKQGKSEGFESCDWPIVRKRPIWVKIGDVLYRVTLKFDGWPWKTIGHLYYTTSSSMHHFVAIGEFKLEVQSGNAQFGSK